MSASVLPDVKCVKELFDSLLGDGTTVKTATAPSRSEPLVVADYQDDDGVVRSRLICDVALADSAGAALSMIPAAVAVEAVKKQEVPEPIFVNLQEVLNICVNVFTGDGHQHLKLGRVALVRPGQPEFPSNASSATAAYHVQIPRYADGTLVAEVMLA